MSAWSQAGEPKQAHGPEVGADSFRSDKPDFRRFQGRRQGVFRAKPGRWHSLKATGLCQISSPRRQGLWVVFGRIFRLSTEVELMGLRSPMG